MVDYSTATHQTIKKKSGAQLLVDMMVVSLEDDSVAFPIFHSLQGISESASSRKLRPAMIKLSQRERVFYLFLKSNERLTRYVIFEADYGPLQTIFDNEREAVKTIEHHIILVSKDMAVLEEMLPFADDDNEERKLLEEARDVVSTRFHKLEDQQKSMKSFNRAKSKFSRLF